jgi:hypothetical protein
MDNSVETCNSANRTRIKQRLRNVPRDLATCLFLIMAAAVLAYLSLYAVGV